MKSIAFIIFLYTYFILQNYINGKLSSAII